MFHYYFEDRDAFNGEFKGDIVLFLGEFSDDMLLFFGEFMGDCWLLLIL